MTVHLYHWEPNANSGKPMLALAEKGVEFESHYIDLLKFDQHQPEYLKINPDGTIPAMVHGDRVLIESTPMRRLTPLSARLKALERGAPGDEKGAQDA